MKTIKFILIGILSIFISVLLLKYTIIALNNTTIDYVNPITKEVSNFALLFAIESIVLAIFSSIAITFAYTSFRLAYKYWQDHAKESRTNELLKHIEDKRYEQLVKDVQSTTSVDKKEEYINDYLTGKKDINLDKPVGNSKPVERLIINDKGNLGSTGNPTTKLEVQSPKRFKAFTLPAQTIEFDKKIYKD